MQVGHLRAKRQLTGDARDILSSPRTDDKNAVNPVDQGYLNCFNRYFLIPGQAKVIEGGRRTCSPRRALAAKIHSRFSTHLVSSCPRDGFEIVKVMIRRNSRVKELPGFVVS
jgi:hypothetical protein